jgi:murein DD-endopeptidase MepM/ murein hydrolase activator NlpD
LARFFLKRQGSVLAFFLSILLPAVWLPPAAWGEDSPGAAGPGAGGLPLISRLDNRDLGFVQYQEDVESSRRNLFGRGREEATLTIYRYVPAEGEDLLSIAARCNVPYAALATINRMSHPPLEGELLLPSVPGIFVPLAPESDLERLMASARSDREGGQEIRVRGEGAFRFFPGDDFSPTERIFFLNRGFRFPLRNFTLTSAFGPRINPVTGRFRVHEGLDLAAPEGTEVYAAMDGLVTEIGLDQVYGNYVVVQHSDHWASLYGHLSRVDAVLRQELRSGSLIGKVGSTGQSTGPHLHFELRRNGRAEDPGKYLFK